MLLASVERHAFKLIGRSYPLWVWGDIRLRLGAWIGKATGMQSIHHMHLDIMVTEYLARETYLTQQITLLEPVVFSLSHPVRLALQELHPAGGAFGKPPAAMQDVNSVVLDGPHQARAIGNYKAHFSIYFYSRHIGYPPYLSRFATKVE